MVRHLVPLSLVLAAFAGCSNSGKGLGNDDPVDKTDATEVEETDAPAPDDDDDGYPADVDCDDADPNSYPGAPEICDHQDNDCDKVIPENEFDQDGDEVVECEEVCGAGPLKGFVTPIQDCDYQPSATGTPFLAKVEWSMTQPMVDPSSGANLPGYTWSDFDGFGAMFHAPAVLQATDDNYDGAVNEEDVPDIAVVMAHVDEFEEGVLRVIQGDGSSVASAHWQSFKQGSVTQEFAPYHYAGVAMGNVDADDEIEVATLVTRKSDNLCYPAIYEVNQSGTTVSVDLEQVWAGANYSCAAHAPALADIDGDKDMELIFGKAVFDGTTFEQQWYGSAAGGRGWYPQAFYADGYWNSGYHSFAYDVDGDGLQMEVIGGSTIYTSEGDTYCELGSYDGNAWVAAKDGYPAVADMLRFPNDAEGEPEIVLTGNNSVSVYHAVPDYDPNGLPRCTLIATLKNDPYQDATIAEDLPAHPNCDKTKKAFGGPPTVSDFDGDGDNEIGVAGACWYTVYQFDEDDNDSFKRYAMAMTKDWSSASTGSTVFDFNGDGQSEVVFSDEEAVYVWGVDAKSGLNPWDRLTPLLVDENHKSWTIHEYPLVADVDADGKAEIVVGNSHLPGFEDRFGIYVLGAADDDWVTARQVWNQHAYYVTNVEDDGDIGYGAPNYSPYTKADLNSFRQQAPGSMGATAAPNLYVQAEPVCQEGCGGITVWVQAVNEGEWVSVSSDVVVSLYGVRPNGLRNLLDSKPLGAILYPASVSPGIQFDVAYWNVYEHLLAVVDDPAVSGPFGGQGLAKECDENDNSVEIPLTGICQ